MNNTKPRISKETETASTYGTVPMTVFSVLICMYPVHIWLLLLHLPFYHLCSHPSHALHLSQETLDTPL